jgi:hypothetical protein
MMRGMADQNIPVLGPLDKSKKNSAFNLQPETGDAAGAGGNVRGATCFYNGVAFSQGAEVCMEGKRYVCNQWGAWDSTFGSCP